MRNFFSRSLFAAILAVIMAVGANAQFKYSPDLSVSVSTGMHQRYFGGLFGSTSKDESSLQTCVTISDKKTGAYFSEWLARNAKNFDKRDGGWENDHTVGIVRPVSKDLTADVGVTYFDCSSDSTDWWDLDTTLRYTKTTWQPFVRAAWLVPTNNTATKGGLFYKIGVEGQALGLTFTTSIGGHGKVLGYSAKTSFAQLIVTKTINIDSTTSFSLAGLAQKRFNNGPDYVETRWPPTFSACVTKTFD